ncbi:hypothetical protein AwEntero_31380 [Enterobacterales bacterium]|nr:hypothetical protein AwEntero_31380 [Enterobacterales bacterium]
MGSNDESRRHKFCYAFILYVKRRVYIPVMLNITGWALPYALM